jgi:hypothetical protein
MIQDGRADAAAHAAEQPHQRIALPLLAALARRSSFRGSLMQPGTRTSIRACGSPVGHPKPSSQLYGHARSTPTPSELAPRTHRHGPWRSPSQLRNSGPYGYVEGPDRPSRPLSGHPARSGGKLGGLFQGTSYTTKVNVGMPSIPQKMFDSCVYLYPDRELALKGEAFGGCGFIIGLPNEVRSDITHLYLISNYHVIRSSPCVRINTIDGGVDVLEFDVSDWTFIPGGGDVAAITLPLNEGVHKMCFLDLEGSGLKREDMQENIFGPGDDVFMIGRFVDHDGGQTNVPAVRFGNISTAPSPLRGTSNSDGTVEYFCLDMHSRSGFSGAPVYVYRTPGNDIDTMLSGTTMLGATQMRLLGVHCGQFPDEMPVRGTDGKNNGVVTGYSGMTYAIPAWRISEVLNLDRFASHRKKLAWKYRSLPMNENGPSEKPQ